jgi:Tfp pilus assembly protein PilF
VSLISDALNEAQREANKRRKESQPALLGENPISPPRVVVAPPYHPWRRIVYAAIGIAVVASALVTGVIAYRRAKSQVEIGARPDSAAAPVAVAPNAATARDTAIKNVQPPPPVVAPRPTQPATKPVQVATNAVRPPIATMPRREAPPSATAPAVAARRLPIRPAPSPTVSNTARTPTGATQPQSIAPTPPAPVTAANHQVVAPPQPRSSPQDMRVIVDPTVLRAGDSLFIRAYAEQTRGNLDAAADLYERALTKPPVSPELYNDYGALLATRGKHAAAITMYNLGIAANDKDARLWANLADSYRAIGRRADAMSAYFEAMKLDPMNVGVRLRLAAEYASLGDTASARHGFDEAVRSAPRDAEAHYRYGAFLQTQHDVGGAIRELQAFVDLAPGKYPSDVIERTKAYIASLRRVTR